jgi:hypothetical protein
MINVDDFSFTSNEFHVYFGTKADDYAPREDAQGNVIDISRNQSALSDAFGGSPIHFH